MAKTRGTIKCSRCGGEGHNKTSCKAAAFTTPAGVRVRQLAPDVMGEDLALLDPVAPAPAPAVDLAVRVRVEIQVVQLNPDGTIILPAGVQLRGTTVTS